MDKITRKSVAVFLVDAAEKDEWDRKTPVLTNQTTSLTSRILDVMTRLCSPKCVSVGVGSVVALIAGIHLPTFPKARKTRI